MKENNCNDNKEVGKYISQLYRKYRVFINREVLKYDIPSGQFMYLIDLYIKDGKSQEEICNGLKMDKGTTARAIAKLEEQGFVNRIKDSEDKRINKVYLTEKSKEIKKDVYSVFDQWNDLITQNLSKEEEETLKILLKKVCKNIKL